MSGQGYHLLLPGPPETSTGGFVYDRQMRAALQRAGRLAGCVVLPGSYPQPSAAARAAADARLRSLPSGAALVVDGLALTPLAAILCDIDRRGPLIALVHHPLADESGLAAALRVRLFAAEREALRLADGVIVTSAHTAARLADFGLPEARIRVVPPGAGAPRGGARPARRTGSAKVILCVGALVPRKGQDVLVRALSALRRHDWRLLLAGPPRDRDYARRLRREIRSRRLDGRIALLGAVPQATLAALYRQADLFVAPSLHEGFGMAAADAAALGLPVVASRVGALPEALAGSSHQLVPPSDPLALAAALRPLLACRSFAKRPRPAAGRSWAAAGDAFVAALDALAAGCGSEGCGTRRCGAGR